MASEASTVARLALDVVEAISELSAKEREKRPSIDLVERVNALIELGQKAATDIPAAMWPTKVEIIDTGYGMTGANTSYAALSAFARQVATLLSPGSGGADAIYGGRAPGRR